MSYNYNKDKIGLAGAVCIGVGVLLAGYLLQNYILPKIDKIRENSKQSHSIEQKANIESYPIDSDKVKMTWQNVYDDDCLKGMHPKKQ